MVLELGAAAGTLWSGRRRRRSGMAAGSRRRRRVVLVVVVAVVASLPLATRGLLVGHPTIEGGGQDRCCILRSTRGLYHQDPNTGGDGTSRIAPTTTRWFRRLRYGRHTTSSSLSSSRGDDTTAVATTTATALLGMASGHQQQQEAFVRWRRRESQTWPDSKTTSSSALSSSGSNSSALDCWCLQTAVMAYERRQDSGGAGNASTTATRVHLYSVVHLGEPGYYDTLNEELAHLHQYDAVVYELLVDDVLLRPKLLEKHDSKDVENRDGGATKQLMRVLAEPVGASDADRNLARSYGLVCQADHVRYTSLRFVHGDLTRQELAQHLYRQRQQANRNSANHDGELSENTRWPALVSPLASLISSLRRQQLYQEEPLEVESTIPLWQQASRWSATQEAATALWVGPPILQTQSKSRRSRSSNDGSFRMLVQRRAIRWFLRPILWLTVPSPEIPILLLDWAALGAENYSSSDNDDSRQAAMGSSSSFPSPVSRAVLASLAAGNWDAARKLAFGQVLLVSSSLSSSTTSATSAQPTASTNPPDDLDWMQLRNQRAMEVVDSIIEQQSASDPASSPLSIAILYGCLHCPDLHSRLQNVGFTPVQKTWRTAWSVPVPAFTGTRLLDPTVLQLLAILVLYLGLGGLDWIATVGDVTHAAANFVRDAAAVPSTSSPSSLHGLPTALLSPSTWNVVEDYALYLVRHLFLYLGLSKFIWSSKD